MRNVAKKTVKTCWSSRLERRAGWIKVTQTWSTASSSMCWVSSISSSTSRNMSFRLSGPLSRASRRASGSPVASRRHDPKHTDSRRSRGSGGGSNMMIPDGFFPLQPPSQPSSRSHSGCLKRRDAPRTHGREQLDPFFIWKVWGVAVCKSGSGSGLTAWGGGGSGGRFAWQLTEKLMLAVLKRWSADVVKEQKALGTLARCFTVTV